MLLFIRGAKGSAMKPFFSIAEISHEFSVSERSIADWLAGIAVKAIFTKAVQQTCLAGMR
jgi:hypothetical protein